MADGDDKSKREELFMVPRRWDELDLLEQMKVKRESEGYHGMSETEMAYVERLKKLSRKHYMGED